MAKDPFGPITYPFSGEWTYPNKTLNEQYSCFFIRHDGFSENLVITTSMASGTLGLIMIQCQHNKRPKEIEIPLQNGEQVISLKEFADGDVDISVYMWGKNAEDINVKLQYAV